MVQAYNEHGYRLREIAAHLGVHYGLLSNGWKRRDTRTQNRVKSLFSTFNT